MITVDCVDGVKDINSTKSDQFNYILTADETILYYVMAVCRHLYLFYSGILTKL